MSKSRPRGPATSIRWRLTPLGVLVGLLFLASVLVLIAQRLYDKRDPDGFQSALATRVLLDGAVVAILGAVVATLLSMAADMRSLNEWAAERRLGLLRRMREAHVRVALGQQILRARRDPDTYHRQMLVLQEVVKEMEEIREEVKVSDRLYDDDDRRTIMKGIALLILYLNDGVSQYVAWCETANAPKTSETRPDAEGSWVGALVADQEADPPIRDPGDEDWDPPGRMPSKYEQGLEQSKLIMRRYVYGASRRKGPSRVRST